LADLLKQEVNKAKVIRLLNAAYFSLSILSVFIIILLYKFLDTPTNVTNIEVGFLAIWSAFLLSRCSEIFYAFIRDAYDKVSEQSSEERKVLWTKNTIKLKNQMLKHDWITRRVKADKLQNHDRLALSFRSYFELIINFSILYLLTPVSFWKECVRPQDVVESLYFSGVTITTLGYGDISPKHWYPQFLTIFEVLCGFSLIVVCFAVYLRQDKS